MIYHDLDIAWDKLKTKDYDTHLARSPLRSVHLSLLNDIIFNLTIFSYSIVDDLSAASASHQWELACLGLVIFLVMLKFMKILSGTKFFELIKAS